MWKREEAVRVPPQPATPPVPAPAPAPVQVRAPEPSIARTEPIRQEKAVVNIGKSVIIKGELSGSEDLTIEGQVEGKIELRQNVLTIGPNAKIKAQVAAKTIVVEGSVQGNVMATERIEIRDKGSVEGDLASPRVAIADGAHFRGSIDMQQGRGAADRAAEHKPAAAASSTPAPSAAPASSQPSPSPSAPAPAGVGAR
jgi:cytoskeletal protein CcmA (bactofilin family)